MKKQKNSGQKFPTPITTPIIYPVNDNQKIITFPNLPADKPQNLEKPESKKNIPFIIQISNRLNVKHTVIQEEQPLQPRLKVLAQLALLCSITANLYSLYLHFTVDFLGTTFTAKLTASIWVISVILAGSSAWFYYGSSIKYKKIKKRPIGSYINRFCRSFFMSRTFRFLFPILLLAFILRILPTMNNSLYLDEWYWLDTAKSILTGTVISPFGFVGDYSSNLPAYPVALVLSIIKNPILSVRLTGIIFSLVTIFFLYELLKDLLGFKTAVIGSLLLAVSAWDIHMSNLGFTNTNINPMLTSGTLLLLYKIYKNKYTFRTIFLLALILAICVHLLYVAAPLVVPALLVLAYHWIKNYGSIKGKEAAIFCAYFLICLSPIIPKIIRYPDQSIARHGDFIQQNFSMAEDSKSPVGYYLDQIGLLFRDYFKGDINFQVNGLWGITIDPAIQLSSIFGILLLIVQAIRKRGDFFWLVSIFTFLLLLFVPFVLLYRTESVWRAYVTLPLIYLFASFAISKVATYFKSITKKIYDLKGLRNFFLVTITVIYFLVSIPWFNNFSEVYLKKRNIYENDICQYATALINSNIPKGSTIMMPDELCVPLITILYDSDQYQFNIIKSDTPEPLVASGSYLIIFNSYAHGGYYREDVQKIAEQIITEHPVKLVSLQSSSQPVLYVLK
jgi:hypothetical protein